LKALLDDVGNGLPTGEPPKIAGFCSAVTLAGAGRAGSGSFGGNEGEEDL
jgi:hypothetical protein